MGSITDQIYQYLGALVHHQAHRVSKAIAGPPNVPACIDHVDLGLHLASWFEMYLLAIAIIRKSSESKCLNRPRQGGQCILKVNAISI